MQKRRAKRKVSAAQSAFEVVHDILTADECEGMGYFIPPNIQHVTIYFLQQEMDFSEALHFYQHYKSTAWKTVKGRPHRNWKVLAKDWIYNKIQHLKLDERRKAKDTAFPDL